MTLRDDTSAKLTRMLEAHTGQNLTPSRQWRVGSALSGLLREHEAASVDELVARLTSPYGCTLSSRVVEALLNNETYFFRDQAIFETIGREALPALARRRADRRKLSIWSIGCSTGQEPVSLAILLAEQRHLFEGWHLDILATDVSTRALDVARKGIYTAFEAQRGLGVNRMIRWFAEAPGGWKVSDNLTARIRYRRHNLLAPPPETSRFDLILCRNVLLYFEPPTRSRAFEQIAQAIAPDGFLSLGAGETVVGQTDLFAPAADCPGLFAPPKAPAAS